MKYRDENGQWQDLYLSPTGDTLPIGAEVDYDGEEVPYGWESAGTGKIRKIQETVGVTGKVATTYTTDNSAVYNAPYINGQTGKILWTNPNPTSNFSGTIITLNSSDYDMYEIIYSSEAGTLNNTLKSTKSIKGYGTIMEITNPSGSVTPIRARNVTYDTDTRLMISDGYTNNVYPLSTDNSKCIPLYIIGYKTGLFS